MLLYGIIKPFYEHSRLYKVINDIILGGKVGDEVTGRGTPRLPAA
jgi:hypothetical protein